MKNPPTNKLGLREIEPDQMTMHDIVATFIVTGLLAGGQYKDARQAVEQSMTLADLFMQLSEEGKN